MSRRHLSPTHDNTPTEASDGKIVHLFPGGDGTVHSLMPNWPSFNCGTRLNQRVEVFLCPPPEDPTASRWWLIVSINTRTDKITETVIALNRAQAIEAASRMLCSPYLSAHHPQPRPATDPGIDPATLDLERQRLD